jgi:Protein of unknown function (DUF1643).
MMNPSKADGNVSDDTINRCIGYCEELNDKYNMGIGNLSVVNVSPFYESQAKNVYQTMLNYLHLDQKLFYDAINRNITYIKKKLSQASFVSLGTGEKPKIDVKKNDNSSLFQQLKIVQKNYVDSRKQIYRLLENYGGEIFVYWPEKSNYELVRADHSAKHLSFWNVAPESNIHLSVAKIIHYEPTIFESSKYVIKLKYGNGKC